MQGGGKVDVGEKSKARKVVQEALTDSDWGARDSRDRILPTKRTQSDAEPKRLDLFLFLFLFLFIVITDFIKIDLEKACLEAVCKEGPVRVQKHTVDLDLEEGFAQGVAFCQETTQVFACTN